MEQQKITALFPYYRSGIRRRLLLIGLVCLAVALLTNTLAGFLYTRVVIRKEAAELQAEIASRLAEEIAAFIERKVQRLSDLSTALSIYELGNEEQKLFALLLLKNDPAFTAVSVLDDKGMEVLKVSERQVYLQADLSDQGQSEKFKKTILGESYISPIYTSNRAEPYVTMAVPIKASAKQVIGVISAEANLRFLWQTIGDVTFDKAGYAYLVDDQGRLIAHRDPSQVLKGRFLGDLPPVKRFLQMRSVSDPNPGQEVKGIDGQSVLSTYAPIPKLGWAVVLEEPIDMAMADLKKMERYAFLLLGIGLVVGAWVIAWVSNRITKPIRELRQSAEIIGSGNLDHHVEVNARDEIGDLAKGFNKMAAELKASYATLEEKVTHRTQELSALYAIASTVNRSLRLEPTLQEAVEKITEIFHFDVTRIFLLDPKTDKYHVCASFETRPEFASEATQVAGRGVGSVGKVAESGEAVIFEDLSSDPRYRQWSDKKIAEVAGFRFWAGFPIRPKTGPSGVIVCIARTPRKFEPTQMRLVLSIADQIAIAVENANLFTDVRQKSEELEALITVNRDVAALLDRKILLPRIAEEARKILNVDAVSFRVLEGDSLIRVAYSGKEEFADAPGKINLGIGISSRVVQEKRSIGIRDILEDAGPSEEFKAKMKSVGYRSYLGVPLVFANRSLGTINLYCTEIREFLPKEIALINAFAAQAAIALENANLFAEIKKSARALENMNRDLERANRTKSDFMAAMSHELRTPMNVIIGNAQLLEDGCFGPVDEKQKEALKKMLRYSQVLLKLINDVLTLTRIEAKKMSLDLSSFQVEDVISEVQTYLIHLNGNHGLEISWDMEPEIPRITTDALKLEEILQNLIGNAVKFTPEGQIKVRIRNLPKREAVEFSVSDTGIGIEPSDIKNIFEQFHQLKEAHTGSYSGVGLGLSIVKTYLELMHGEIQVESEPGKGSTFTFTLPYVV